AQCVACTIRPRTTAHPADASRQRTDCFNRSTHRTARTRECTGEACTGAPLQVACLCRNVLHARSFAQVEQLQRLVMGSSARDGLDLEKPLLVAQACDDDG